MRCPRDGTSLTTENYEGDVAVERCPACRGFWLDQGELEKVQETLEHDHSERLSNLDLVARAYELARQNARPGVSCPSCGTALEAEEYAYCSQILVDRCPQCGGIWFDNGEVQALEQFFEQETGKGMQRGFFGSLVSR
jgi:uncharacterized protein